jgi:hypothetical protein
MQSNFRGAQPGLTMIERDLKYGADETPNPVAEEVQRDVVGWQQSQERVLRYLKAMGVTPLQSLELAHQTLKLAVTESAAKRGLREHPTRVAMRLLSSVLAEADLSIEFSESLDLFDRGVPPGLPPQLCQTMPVMPALNRSSMLPDMKPVRLFKGLIAFLFSRKISPDQNRPIL